MAESYFELLTEQDGIPAKPFNPVEELKRLRRGLALRLQVAESAMENVVDPPPHRFEICPAKIEPQHAVVVPITKTVSPETEPVSLESVMEKAGSLKNTLALWQRSRIRTKPAPNDIFRGNFHGRQKFGSKKQSSLSVTQYLTTPQEETLEIVNAGLVALGIIGVVFGFLSFWRGTESDLSFGSLVCATGVAVVFIGLGGRFLASRSHFSRGRT